MFVPLRIHSGYSLREGLVRLPELVAEVARRGWPALALTDRDHLFGAAPLAQLARDAGIQPITGAVLTLADGTALTLLVAEAAGYPRLNRLLTARHLVGPPGWDQVAAEAEGLLALCGGEDGAPAAALRAGDPAGALAAARRLRDVFGDRAWLEAPRPDLALLALSDAAGVPLAAVRPVRYLHAADAGVWVTARRGWKRYPQAAPDYHLPDAGWLAAWRALPGALAATAAIAARCAFIPPLGAHHLPRLAGNGGARLRALCEAGLGQRAGEAPPAGARARLEHELAVIGQMGFDDYFLIQWRVVHWARGQGIPVGPGRGSAAGSLVAYLLRLADVCPLAHDLTFERFLNPGRRELPDIDLDFCWLRRDEAIGHLFDTYGAERVARVATISTLGGRAAIRLAGAGLGLEEARIDQLAKYFGWRPIDEELRLTPALREVPWGREPYKPLLAAARALEGQPDHVGMHPCGVVVTPGPLTDLVPLMRAADGTVLIQADKGHAEALGLLKMDLLANRNLTILHAAARAVTEATGTPVDPDAIPLDDPAAFALLGSGRTLGLYQLESTGVQGMLRAFGPATLEDMTAITSLYRPGPIAGGLKDIYLARRFGREPTTFPHPCLAPILAHTFGTVLFQEQAMQVAVVFAGLGWDEADAMRRAIARYRPAELARMRDRFFAGARAQGHDEAATEAVFKMLGRFAGYGFVKAHAAASQVLAIRQAWLKARWPAHYLAAVLASGQGYYQPRVYIEDALAFGAVLGGPCLNRSQAGWTVERTPEGRWLLRPGLGEVSEVGRAAARIVAARGARPFSSLADFAARVAVDRGAAANLVKAGAADALLASRAAALWELGQRAGTAVRETQGTLFGAAIALEPPPLLLLAADHDVATRRAHERALLGFAVTPAPLPTVAGTIPLAEAAARAGGTRVAVVAEIVYGRRARTKDGQGFVVFLILSDGLSHLAATVFPRAHARCWSKLGWNEPRLVVGHLDHPDGETQLVVEDVRRVSD